MSIWGGCHANRMPITCQGPTVMTLCSALAAEPRTMPWDRSSKTGPAFESVAMGLHFRQMTRRYRNCGRFVREVQLRAGHRAAILLQRQPFVSCSPRRATPSAIFCAAGPLFRRCAAPTPSSRPRSPSMMLRSDERSNGGRVCSMRHSPCAPAVGIGHSRPPSPPSHRRSTTSLRLHRNVALLRCWRRRSRKISQRHSLC